MSVTKHTTALKPRERDAARYSLKTLPRLIMVTDRVRVPDVIGAIKALPSDSAVLFRDYDMPHRLELGREIRDLCRRRKFRFIMAGHGRFAAQIRADGLHTPETCIQEARFWRQWRPKWFITVAAHSPAALWQAARAGADAALLSPVFSTNSHPHTKPLGALNFAKIAFQAPLPVYAFGGINKHTLIRLTGVPICGVAAVSAFSSV